MGSGRELKCVAVFNPFLIILFLWKSCSAFAQSSWTQLSLKQFNFSLVLHLLFTPSRISCRVLNRKRVKVGDSKGDKAGRLSSEYDERRCFLKTDFPDICQLKFVTSVYYLEERNRSRTSGDRSDYRTIRERSGGWQVHMCDVSEPYRGHYRFTIALSWERCCKQGKLCAGGTHSVGSGLMTGASGRRSRNYYLSYHNYSYYYCYCSAVLLFQVQRFHNMFFNRVF